MRQKLIVMSADALVVEDMELLETLPNFKKYLSRGARIKSVRSIYPTVTYPCHVTIATGCYPDRHGVTNNSAFRPGALLESSGIVNLAPTLAKALGFSMENTDGRPEYALLNLPLIPSR
jgi:predicted AlkP superfamily phosphohydrolase/phosphomutase